MNAFIEKAAKKAGIIPEEALAIIGYAHVLKALCPKSKLKRTTMDLDLDSLQKIRKIARILKVDMDAVIGHALVKALENSNEKTI